jgi:hypothetical protein
MSEVAVYLDGEDRGNFLERMLRPFSTHREAAEWFFVSKEWIDSFSSGRQQAVKLDTFLEMREVLENIELELFDFDLEERLSQRDRTARDSGSRPELRDDWKRYVFDRFTNRELAEMTEYGKQSVDNYSPGSLDRNPPKEFWRNLNGELDRIYRNTRLSNMEASLLDLGDYGSAHRSLEQSSFADCTVSQLFFLDEMASNYSDFVEELKAGDSMVQGSYDELFGQIQEELEAGNRYISPSKYDMSPQKAGLGLKVLSESGLLKKWSRGNRSTYRIQEDVETVEKARMLFSPSQYSLEADLEDVAEQGLEAVDLDQLYTSDMRVTV